MRQKARSTAQFYVSRASHLKDLTREELGDALRADAGLLPQIAHARFLSRDAAPVFATFSCADMQWHELQRHLPRVAESCGPNPDPHRPPDLRNPASLRPSDVANTPDQFAALLNRLQQHTCSPAYCLRTEKGGAAARCPFFYPRPLASDKVNQSEELHVRASP
ncbi:hypothetical protein VE03_10249 [Pseudogymnoascus sp. 23342-1-I1]|nr:hypothetical protein VE03_10249 [Pseudogymnoascus sp. 23342-1-I1]